MTILSIKNCCDYPIQVSTGVARGDRGSWGLPLYETLQPQQQYEISNKKGFARTITFNKISPPDELTIYNCFSGEIIIRDEGFYNGFGTKFKSWGGKKAI